MAKKDFSQLVAHVEQKQEVKEEATNLNEQLKLLKEAVTHIINNTLTLEHEGKNIEKLVEALNARTVLIMPSQASVMLSSKPIRPL